MLDWWKKTGGKVSCLCALKGIVPCGGCCPRSSIRRGACLRAPPPPLQPWRAPSPTFPGTYTLSFLSQKFAKISHTVTKSFSIFPPPAGMSLIQNSPLGGNNDVIYKLFSPRESLVSDIPAGDGNIEKLFYGVRLCKMFIFILSIFQIYYIIPTLLSKSQTAQWFS